MCMNRENKTSMFKTWKFGTINIRSGKEKGQGDKIYAITKQIAKLKLSFCSLQEVKYRNSGSKLIELDSGEKYEFHWIGMKKRREHGVGVLIKHDKDIEVSEPDIIDHRIIAFNIKIFGFSIRLVNAYAPTESAGSLLQKDNFYRSIKKACCKRNKHQKLILTGDFNATTSVSLQKSNFDGSQIITDEICNDNGTRIKSFCRDNSLCMASTFFEHPLENRYTWYSCDHHTIKKVDYVLVQRFVQQYVTECMVRPEIDFDTDHKLLLTEMYTPTTRRARWKKKKIRMTTKKNVSLLRDIEIKTHFCDKINEKLTAQNIRRETTEETSKTMVAMVTDVANTVLPNLKRGNAHDQVWKKDAVLNELLNQRMDSTTGSERHKELTKQIKKRVKHLRNERLKREADEMNDYANRRKIEQLFKQVKFDNSPFKNIKTNSKCDPTKLKEHFQKHFSKPINETSLMETVSVEIINLLQNISNEPLCTNAPDTNEILDVIKTLKQGKASSDLPSEYIKAAVSSRQFLEETVNLYQTIWRTQEIPQSWSHSKLVAIWKGAKKGSITDPEAYRALQISSSLSKILVVIIIKRIQAWYEKQLTDQQQGFRKGRSTTDGIYIAKRVHQITDQMKLPVYALFVDLTAVFDKVARQRMFDLLKKRLPRHYSKKLIDLLEVLYSKTTTALAEAPDNVFDVECGMRQGGPESSRLFNLYIDMVMRIFLHNCMKEGIQFLKFKYRMPRSASHNGRDKIGRHQIDWIGYADDLILTFGNSTDLRRVLQLLDETFGSFSLAINKTKTKTMILNHQYSGENYPNSICQLHGIPIENVEKFIYLGSCIKYDEPGTGKTEVELRIDLAESALYQLSGKFFNKRIAI